MGLDLTRLALALGRRAPNRPPTASTTGVVVGESADGDLVYFAGPSLEHAGHLALFGSSGCGKTSLVAGALLAEIRADSACPPEQRRSILVCDPKGDTAALLLSGLATMPERLADVRWLDPFSAGGFPFNLNRLALGETPLDIRALALADLVANVSTATGAQAHLGVGARQRDVLQHVILGALACSHPGASLLLALDALELPDGLARLAFVTASERARQFCRSVRLGEELRVSSGSRLRVALAATESLARLIGAPTCVQFDDLLAPGRITLVNLGNPFGGLVALQTFYANLVVRLASDHLLSRPSPWPGHHTRVVVDEAQTVAGTLADTLERAYTVGRSKGVSFVTATQSPVLIQAASDTLLRVLLTNSAGGKIIGRLGATDAELLARERAPARGVDESVSVVRARLLSAITSLEDREFIFLRGAEHRRFTAAPLDVAGWEAASRDRADAVRAAKERVTLPKELPPRFSLAEVALPKRSRGAPSGNDAAPSGASEPSKPPRSRWG